MLVHDAALHAGRLAGVCTDRKVCVNPAHQWRGLEFNVNALGAVLKVPLAAGVGFVVALDEAYEFVVPQQRALAHCAPPCKRSGGLSQVVTHEPVATRIKP